MGMTRRPVARSAGLITEDVGDQLLVYDERSDRAHCLSAEAARVWRRCDGATPVTGLAAQVGLDPSVVERALDELDACELLEAPPGDTRRELGVKLIRGAGGVAVGAPLIFSVLAPTAGAAQTINCSKIGSCVTNCGNNASGCTENVTGATCKCCQLTNGTCPNGFVVTNNVKFCANVAAACPTQFTACC